MKRYGVHISLWAFMLLATACHNDPPVVMPQGKNTTDLRQNMINANRTIARSEETSIDEYVARRGWKMAKTGSGVRLWDYEVGQGPQVAYEDSVHIVSNLGYGIGGDGDRIPQSTILVIDLTIMDKHK